MSISHQEQPSTIFSCDNILSSSSSSHIFRTLSLSANNLGDNTSGHFRTSNGSVIFFEENFLNQTTSYLLGPPSITFIEKSIPTKPISPSPIEKKKLSSDDSYALVEPLSAQNSSLSSLPIVSIKTESSINYTDVQFSSNAGDMQEESSSSDDRIHDKKNERSSTIFYTDIDFQQTQRRTRIAQFAAISNSEDQMPPFVL